MYDFAMIAMVIAPKFRRVAFPNFIRGGHTAFEELRTELEKGFINHALVSTANFHCSTLRVYSVRRIKSGSVNSEM